MFSGSTRAAIVSIVLAAVLVAVPVAVAHPPEQHDSQRVSYVSPVAQLQDLLDVGGLTAQPRIAGEDCEDGMAGPYECENVDLESFTPLPVLGGVTGNDIWGWTDPATGKEYAIVGTSTSVGFVDVSDAENPVLIGFLPTSGVGATVLWRDVKVYDNHAFIVSEIDDSGMQVFDLTRLRDASAPEIFTEDAFYDKLSNTHNIAINEESGFAYAVGNTGGLAPPLTTDPEPCESSSGEGGGLHMIDINDPVNPTFAGCAIVGTAPGPGDPENNYVHDADCRIYDGPDAAYIGREICFGSNENAVVIYDVTDKQNPVVLSETTYPTAAYTHQGWLTDDGEYFIFGDELDEGVASEGTPPGSGNVPNTATYIMPVSDLDNPGEVKTHLHETNSIDHNMFIHEGRLYQSNYSAGLRIHDLDNASLAAGKLNEVGYFDFLPGVDVNDFAGTWSNYPYFDSGIVIVSAIEEQQNGLLILRPTLPDTGGGTGGTGAGAGTGTAGDPAAPGGQNAGGACSNPIVGAAGSQKLKGTDGSDRISGKGGRDRINGRGGDDCIRGGGGRDRIGGGGGDDEIRPGRGEDRIRGGGGDDEIRAGRGGRDRVSCGRGKDVAIVNERKDRVADNCETLK